MGNSLNKRLREGDPLQREPELTNEQVERIRTRVLASAPPPITASARPMRLALAGLALAAALVTAGVAGSYFRAAPAAVHVQPVESTRIQFETPGGTRIIWVLNPNLEF